MKKKFKLIKKYPGSPKLGTIISQLGTSQFYEDKNNSAIMKQCFDYKIFSKYPEFWEEIVEKDYEILSFWCKQFNYELKLDKDSGKYINDFKKLDYEYLLKATMHYSIHKIKRLSDGEIFTVGGKVNSYIIDTICLSEKGIKIFFQDERLKPYLLKDIILRKPLFTTEDGVDMYEGEEYYAVCPTTITSVWSIADDESLNTNWKKFSTKKAAEEYILMNKPCLSINDVIDFKGSYDSNFMKNKLTTLVKNRLNGESS